MPHAFLVNSSPKYIVELTKMEKMAAKLIGNVQRLLQERWSRDFQLTKEQQNARGADLY